MKRAWFGLVILLVGASPALAQIVDTRKLELDPAEVPVPALKYKLLPEAPKMEPGNAATQYYRAALIAADVSQLQPEIVEKLHDWSASRAEEIPLEEAGRVVDTFVDALDELRFGARRGRCEWDLPIESEGISLRLDGMSHLRTLVRVLNLKMGRQVAQGRYADAIDTARTGLAVAQHLNEGPTLIHSLIGLAAGQLMLSRLEELAASPKAPSLYWAATSLPRPFLDMRSAMHWESDILLREFPILRRVRGALTEKEQRELTEQLMRFFTQLMDRPVGPPEAWQSRLALTAFAATSYPRAKRYLVEQGRSAQEVEAMPALQVVAIHSLDVFEELRDDVFKWFYVPYPQAQKGFEEASRYLHTVGREKEGIPFASTLLPAVGAAYGAGARTDRAIAALRTIEAIRIYAAGHDRRLPASLADITEVPVPLDPATGEPFRYRVEGDTAVLDAPPLYSRQVVYELTIRPRTAPVKQGEQE